MTNSTFTDEMVKLIEQKRNEIKALEAALKIISPDYSSTYVDTTDTQSIDVSSNDGQIDLNSLGVEPVDHGPTLAERVQAVFKQIPPDQEFTVAHVEALLSRTGFVVKGKSPRARLSMIMTHLEEKGFVLRTAKPKGFKPHKFMLIIQDDHKISVVK